PTRATTGAATRTAEAIQPARYQGPAEPTQQPGRNRSTRRPAGWSARRPARWSGSTRSTWTAEAVRSTGPGWPAAVPAGSAGRIRAARRTRPTWTGPTWTRPTWTGPTRIAWPAEAITQARARWIAADPARPTRRRRARPTRGRTRRPGSARRTRSAKA